MPAEAPHIVIRTSKGREAEDADLAWLAELLSSDGTITLFVDTGKREEDTLGKLWFPDWRAATMWGRMRAKELASEGVEVYASQGVRQTFEDFPDKRASVPLGGSRASALAEMLQW